MPGETIVTIRNRTELEAWLQGKDRPVATIIALRAALRVAPLLIGLRMRAGGARGPSTLILPLFRGLAATWMATRFPDIYAETDVSVAYQAVETAIAGISADATNAGKAAANAIIYAAETCNTADVVAAAASAATFAAAAAAPGKASEEGDSDAMYATIAADAAEFDSGARVGTLASHSIFASGQTAFIEKRRDEWDRLKSQLHSRKENWDVWTSWYDDRLAGRPADEDKELARVTLPETMWRQGVKVANAEIARRFAEIDARRAREAKPREPDQLEGSRLELTADRGLGFAVGVASADVDDPAVQASLHGQLKRALPRLRDAVVTPNHTYSDLEDVLAEYHALLGVPFDRLDVAELWGAGAALLGMADAFETQDTDRTLTNPLEPQQLALLRQAAQLHGAFVLGFPLARRLMDAAERFKLASDTIAAIEGPTAEMLRRLGEQHDWVEESARKFIATLGIAYHETGWKVTASGYSAYVLVRNALVVVTRHLSKANSAFATVAGGYVAAQIDPGSEVTFHAMRFVVEHARTIMEFAQPFPELRAWFGWVIDHLDEQNRKK